MNDKQLSGSNTAKNGFKNEDDIVDKFNNWKNDEDAKKWLHKRSGTKETIKRI